MARQGQSTEEIDLTFSSPEPSPACAHRASHTPASPTAQYKARKNPRSPLIPPQPAQQDVVDDPASPEWVDLSLLRRGNGRSNRTLNIQLEIDAHQEEANCAGSLDAEWRPSQTGAASKGATAGAATRTNKSGNAKRTREQIAADATEKKAAKAREAALRKEQKEYDSDKHVLKYLTVLLDPSLMVSATGLSIADAFRKTQAAAEHERIIYKVHPTSLQGFSAIQWTRKVPKSFIEESQGPSSSAATGSSIEFEERLEPHTMICFEGEAFVDAVLKDQLQNLWSQLTEHCSGHRVHLLVHRLDSYLSKWEKQNFQADMRAGRETSRPSRGTVDRFVNVLAIERPGVTFKDARDADEAANHACLWSKAIAKSILKKSDANSYLLAKGKKDSTNAAALLASHPLESSSTKTVMQSLCALPSVGPKIAHPIATKFASLGALGAYLANPSESAADKRKALENMQRVGAARSMRIGPKAAKQLVDLLMCEDPDMLVHDDDPSTNGNAAVGAGGTRRR